MQSVARHMLGGIVPVAAILSASLMVVQTGASQSLPSDPSVDNGTHWYGSYDGVHENVSLSSGNLSFCIPLVSLKGSNKHDLTVPLCYNSQFQELGTANRPGGQEPIGDVLGYFPWVWAPNTPTGPRWALVPPRRPAAEFLPNGHLLPMTPWGGLQRMLNAPRWATAPAAPPIRFLTSMT